MCFTLTEKAVLCLTEMKKQGIEIPERLLPLFADMEKKLTAMKRKNLNWKFPEEPIGYYCTLAVLHAHLPL